MTTFRSAFVAVCLLAASANAARVLQQATPTVVAVHETPGVFGIQPKSTTPATSSSSSSPATGGLLGLAEGVRLHPSSCRGKFHELCTSRYTCMQFLGASPVGSEALELLTPLLENLAPGQAPTVAHSVPVEHER